MWTYVCGNGRGEGPLVLLLTFFENKNRFCVNNKYCPLPFSRDHVEVKTRL